MSLSAEGSALPGVRFLPRITVNFLVIGWMLFQACPRCQRYLILDLPPERETGQIFYDCLQRCRTTFGTVEAEDEIARPIAA
jgi:hypothetical protein